MIRWTGKHWMDCNLQDFTYVFKRQNLHFLVSFCTILYEISHCTSDVCMYSGQCSGGPSLKKPSLINISGCRCFVNVSVQAILWTTTASVSFRLEKHGQLFTCLLPVWIKFSYYGPWSSMSKIHFLDWTF